MTFHPFDRAELSVDDLIQGDVALASPPEIYTRLRRLLETQSATTAQIAAIIEHDPALAARLLRIVNSPLSGISKKVGRIADAVHLLGVDSLQQLVLATEVIQQFRSVPEELADIYGFWRDSLRCAVLARALAMRSPSRDEADAIFIGALLHRIGQLVIYSRVPELGRKALLESRYRGLPLCEAERAVMGFDYVAVSAALARRWELPEIFCSMVEFQQEPQKAGEFIAAAALLHLAARLAQARSFGIDALRAAVPAELGTWALAGVGPAVVEDVAPDADRDFRAALTLLA